MGLALGTGVVATACVDADTPPAVESPPVSPPPPAVDQITGSAWSPDGRRIIVAWDRGGGERLFGLLAGLPDEPPVPSAGLPLSYGRERHPTWSPDRLWVAYETGPEAVPSVHRMRPDGSDPQLLRRFAADPAWSPRGDAVAYVRAEPGQPRALHLMGPDGEGSRLVDLEVFGGHFDPAWSPDGRLLAVTVVRPDGPTIHVVDPDRGNESWVLGTGTTAVWSADGEHVYVERDGGIVSVAVASLEASVTVADARLPEVDPTGGRLAFVRGNPPQGALYLLDLESGTEVRITRGREDGS